VLVYKEKSEKSGECNAGIGRNEKKRLCRVTQRENRYGNFQ
jgi:hypothetical protein